MEAETGLLTSVSQAGVTDGLGRLLRTPGGPCDFWKQTRPHWPDGCPRLRIGCSRPTVIGCLLGWTAAASRETISREPFKLPRRFRPPAAGTACGAGQPAVGWLAASPSSSRSGGCNVHEFVHGTRRDRPRRARRRRPETTSRRTSAEANPASGDSPGRERRASQCS